MNGVSQILKRTGFVSAGILILVQVLAGSLVPLVLSDTVGATQDDGSIKVKKFEDTNGNGQLDNGENDDLAGFMLKLYQRQQGQWVYQSYRTSHDSDWVYWSNLDYDDYYVCEEKLAGWTQTYPNANTSGSVGNTSPNSASEESRCWSFELKHSNQREELYFGNKSVPRYGSITIKKDVDNGKSNIGFPFTSTIPNSESFTLYDDDVQNTPREKTISNVPLDTKYTVTELVPAGWKVKDIDCDPSNNTSINKTSGVTEITLTAQKPNVTCEYENEKLPTGTLRLIKEVENNHGGTAGYEAFTPTLNGQNSTWGTHELAVGTYVVSELVTPGYELKYIKCYKTDYTWIDVQHPVQLEANKDVTCKVKNQDIAPTLTLVKEVVNQYGQPANKTAWTLKATPTNGTELSGVGGFAATDAKANLEYTLSETGGVAGYAAGDWQCTGSSSWVSGNKVTLALDEDVVCTIVNTATAPTLTVTKVVVNDNGGTLQDNNFPLYVTSIPLPLGAVEVTSEVPHPLASTGTYYVWEVQQNGYKLTNVAGDCEYFFGLIYVKADEVGVDYKCTLTNDDQPATITVKKIVKNNHGGTLDSHDFDDKLIANQTKLDHWETIEVNAGKHKLWEVPTPGYKLTDISCYSGLHKVSDFNGWFATVNLDLDQDVLCIYTNEDIAPKVTVKKVAYGANQTDEFQFKLNPAGHNNTEYFGLKNWQTESFDIKAGDVTVEEKNLPDNWVLTDSYCKEKTWYGWKTVGQGTEFNAEIGEEYLCVFVNDKKGDISGYKFSDVNANGKWDEEEPALAGWEITIQKWGCRVEQPAFDEQEVSSYVYQNENSERYIELEKDCGFNGEPTTTPTNENGAYNFGQLDYGKYKVCEVPQAGWLQTKPNPDVFDGCYFVWVSRLGRSFENKNFGNHQLTIEYAATPVCRNSFPYLQWTVTPSVPQAMFTPTQFTLDWLTEAGNAAGDPAGILVDTQVFALADVDYDPVTNTYSSETLWPGTDTILPDWPGWKLVGGEWVEDPSDFGGNLRPSASTVMQVNPTADTSVAYPPETEGCDPSNPQVLGASTLADTGTPVLLATAFALFIVATSFVVIKKREA